MLSSASRLPLVHSPFIACAFFPLHFSFAPCPENVNVFPFSSPVLISVSLFLRISLSLVSVCFLSDLTVWQLVKFSALSRLPRVWGSRDADDLVRAVLGAMGLAHVADHVIGDEGRRGISGGERKRVNVCLELCALPVLLLLDEPTSGLDAMSALEVCRTLNMVASVTRATVAMVIHQVRGCVVRCVSICNRVLPHV